MVSPHSPGATHHYQPCPSLELPLRPSQTIMEEQPPPKSGVSGKGDGLCQVINAILGSQALGRGSSTNLEAAAENIGSCCLGVGSPTWQRTCVEGLVAQSLLRVILSLGIPCKSNLVSVMLHHGQIHTHTAALSVCSPVSCKRKGGFS